MTEAEKFLKINGWYSDYKSIDNPLQYLKNNKSGSVTTKISFESVMKNFCINSHKLPDEIIQLPEETIENMVESYLSKQKISKTRNTYRSLLYIFFRQNKRDDIAIQHFFQSSHLE